MAIGTLSQYGSQVGLRNVYAPAWEEGLYKNNDLTGLTIGGRPVFERASAIGGGDSAYRWKFHTAGNTSSEIFTEGAAQSTPVAQSYANAAVDYVYFRAMTRVTGHVRDAAQGQGVFPGLDVVELESVLAMEDLMDLINTTFMGATNSGLEVAVDSSTNYAGITRSSSAFIQATETALSSTLTLASLMDQMEFSRDNDKGSRIGVGGNGVILTAHNQLTNYISLVGAPNSSNTSFRFNFDNSSRGMDLMPSAYQLSLGGVPVVGIGDFLDTIWIGLDTRPGKNLLVERRAFDVRGPYLTGDDDVFQYSWAGVLVNKNPRFDWKLTGVTA